MAVAASPDIIRDMENTLRQTVYELKTISDGIEKYVNCQDSWNDEQSNRYKELMLGIAKLTSVPSEDLEKVIPKLEILADALEGYNRVRF